MKSRYETLIIGYLTGELTEGERKSLADALRADAACREKYDELVKLYGQSRIPAFEDRNEENYARISKKISASQKSAGKFRPQWTRFSRIAAIVAIAALSTALIHYVVKDNAARDCTANEITVPLGSQTKIILPDASIVWLNSGSIISYDGAFGRKQRVVSLVGEGYFEVKSNARKEFIVRVGKLNIEVVGTKFNVKSYPDDHVIDVSVLEGAVKVYLQIPYEGITLRPDQNLAYAKGSGTMEVTRVDAYKTTLWAEGKLCFVNTPLSDIMKDLERAYNIRIDIKSDKIYRERFSGSVSTRMTIDDVFSYVDVDNKYTWSLEGNVLTLRDR